MECFDKHQLQHHISTLHKVEQINNVPIIFHNTLIGKLLTYMYCFLTYMTIFLCFRCIVADILAS